MGPINHGWATLAILKAYTCICSICGPESKDFPLIFNTFKKGLNSQLLPSILFQSIIVYNSNLHWYFINEMNIWVKTAKLYRKKRKQPRIYSNTLHMLCALIALIQYTYYSILGKLFMWLCWNYHDMIRYMALLETISLIREIHPKMLLSHLGWRRRSHR